MLASSNAILQASRVSKYTSQYCSGVAQGLTAKLTELSASSETVTEGAGFLSVFELFFRVLISISLAFLISDS